MSGAAGSVVRLAVAVVLADRGRVAGAGAQETAECVRGFDCETRHRRGRFHAVSRSNRDTRGRVPGARSGRRHRLEDVARRHLSAVDVQRDRRFVDRVGEDVIFERRNEAAGRPDGGVHAALGLELVAARRLFDEIVLRHVHPPFDHAFDAPDAGVIVERRLLARSPRHDDRRVTERVVAMQEPARVAVGPRPAERLGQRDRARPDGVLELLLDAHGDRRGIAEADGGIEACDEVGQAAHWRLSAKSVNDRRMRCSNALSNGAPSPRSRRRFITATPPASATSRRAASALDAYASCA